MPEHAVSGRAGKLEARLRVGRYLHHGLDRIVAQGLQQLSVCRFGVPAFRPPVFGPPGFRPPGISSLLLYRTTGICLFLLLKPALKGTRGETPNRLGF